MIAVQARRRESAGRQTGGRHTKFLGKSLHLNLITSRVLGQRRRRKDRRCCIGGIQGRRSSRAIGRVIIVRPRSQLLSLFPSDFNFPRIQGFRLRFREARIAVSFFLCRRSEYLFTRMRNFCFKIQWNTEIAARCAEVKRRKQRVCCKNQAKSDRGSWLTKLRWWILDLKSGFLVDDCSTENISSRFQQKNKDYSCYLRINSLNAFRIIIIGVLMSFYSHVLHY